MSWYTKSFRRHLLDMHIADWDDRFLSEFDPETYVENLKTAQVQTAMLYLQSHVGLCYFPSKVAPMHRAFRNRPDAMRQLMTLCRAAGITVMGYYSVIFNTWAEQTHPDWGMVRNDGRSPLADGSRYGHCCPNHPEYRAFVAAQIREMLDYFDPDGMFYDMPFWPVMCACPHCRARWAAETGQPWPEQEDAPELLAARRRWMAEFIDFVTAETKRIRPIPVEYNCASAALPSPRPCISEEVCRSGDYAGGDLYATFRTQSLACKLYDTLTKNPPFEYMTGRCMPSLAAHTITKSKDRLTLAVMLTAAHNGANLIIDAIDPVGTMDARVYRLIGEIYGQAKAYEPSMTGQLCCEARIYFDQTCKDSPRGHRYNHYTGVLGAYETLSRAHIAAGICCKSNLTGLRDARVLILPEPGALTDETRRAILDYVSGGGTLYFSGAGEPTLLKTLLGAECTGETPDAYNYLAPTACGAAVLDGFNDKYPLPIPDALPIVTGVAPEYIAATITLPYQPQAPGQFASIHSNPPGMPTAHPGLVIRPYGAGMVIWCAGPLESMDTEAYRTVLLRLSADALPESDRLICTDAPKSIELVPSAADDRMRISAVALTEEDEAVLQPPFTLSVRAPRPADAVVLLPAETPVPFTQENGRIRFVTRPLHIHDRYEIRWK